MLSLAKRPPTTGSSCSTRRAQPQAVAAGRAAARSAANLEKATLKLQTISAAEGLANGPAGTKDQWQVNATEYSDGYRVCAFRRAPRSLFPDPDDLTQLPRAGGAVVRERAVVEKTAESIGRSKRLIVHRARCLGARYLWTFTKRGKFESSDAVWDAWGSFRQWYRRRFHRCLDYVAVPELHSDGETWHLHVAFAEWHDVVPLRRLWYRALGGTGKEVGSETPGSLNAKHMRGRGGVRAVAQYIAGYCGKGFERDALNRRVFRGSVGLRPCAQAKWHALDEPCRYEFSVLVADFFHRHMRRSFARAWYFDEQGLEGFVLQL